MTKTLVRCAVILTAIGCMIWIGLVSPQGNTPKSQPQATLTTNDLIRGIEAIRQEKSKAVPPPAGPKAVAGAAPAGAANRALTEVSPWFKADLGSGSLPVVQQIAAFYEEKRVQEQAVKTIIDKKWKPARAQYDNAANPAEKAAAEDALRKAQAEMDRAGVGMVENGQALASALKLAREGGLLSPLGLSKADYYYDQSFMPQKKYSGH